MVYVEAEKELQAYFLSCLGVAAQGYETGGTTNVFDSTAAIDKAMTDKRRIEAIRENRRIEWTLERVTADDAYTLRTAYHPRRVGNGMYQAIAGHLAALGLETAAATRQHLRDGLVQWLDDQATQGSAKRVLGPIRAEAEARLTRALARYDLVRRERLHVEAADRRATEAAKANKLASALGDVRPRIRAPKVRPEVASIAQSIAALLADHADLLEPAPASS